MHKLFSCETRRAFDNKRMWAVLLFTFLLALVHGLLLYFGLARLSLCVAFYVGNPFFVLMFPFMVYFLFCELCNILGFGRLSPASYLSPGQSYAIAGPGVILTETAVLLVFTCVFFNWKIRKIEVF